MLLNFGDPCSQVRALNRLQLHVQQLQEQQQPVSSQTQHATQSQSCTTLAPASTILESEAKHSIGSSAVHSILQAGALQSCARSAYATSVSVAFMQQPHASLQAVATAANLVHELAAVRKSRVAALAVVDLCSSGSCVNLGADEDGALNRNSRCMQVLHVATVAIVFTHSAFTGGFECQGLAREVRSHRSKPCIWMIHRRASALSRARASPTPSCSTAYALRCGNSQLPPPSMFETACEVAMKAASSRGRR